MEHDFCFSRNIGNFIIPIDELIIFQTGGSNTNQIEMPGVINMAQECYRDMWYGANGKVMGRSQYNWASVQPMLQYWAYQLGMRK